MKARRAARYEDDSEAQEKTKKYREQLQHLQWERDPLLLVLRGHLYIEQELNYLLWHRIPPNDLKRLNLRFKRKLDLAQGLKLISKPLYLGAELLNQYRNRLAHNLDGVVGSDEAEAFYRLLEQNGVFKGSRMARADDPVVTLSRCIRAVYSLFSTEVLTAQTGRRFKATLMPWVTHEINKESFEEQQRASYEEARRLEKVLNESPEARAELDRMVEQARRRTREIYGDVFEDKG
jgi:hypothetical protein